MITRTRAIYLLRTKGPMGDFRMAYKPSYSVNDQFVVYPDGITQAEDAFLKEQLANMSASSTAANVIYEIAEGRLVVAATDQIRVALGLNK